MQLTFRGLDGGVISIEITPDASGNFRKSLEAAREKLSSSSHRAETIIFESEVVFDFNKLGELSDEEINKRISSFTNSSALRFVAKKLTVSSATSDEAIKLQEEEKWQKIYDAKTGGNLGDYKIEPFTNDFGDVWFHTSTLSPSQQGHSLSKFHIRLARDPENLKKAFPIIARIAAKHKVKHFKYANDVHVQETGNPIGKECVVYAFSQEEIAALDLMVNELEEELALRGIKPNEKESMGDLRMKQCHYCYSRNSHTVFGNYLSASYLSAAGFCASESAFLGNGGLFLSGRKVFALPTSQEAPLDFTLLPVTKSDALTQDVTNSLLPISRIWKLFIDPCDTTYFYGNITSKCFRMFYPKLEDYKRYWLISDPYNIDNKPLTDLIKDSVDVICDLSRQLGMEFPRSADGKIKIGKIEPILYKIIAGFYNFVTQEGNTLGRPDVPQTELEEGFLKYLKDNKPQFIKEIVACAFRSKTCNDAGVPLPDPTYLFQNTECCGCQLTVPQFVGLVEDNVAQKLAIDVTTTFGAKAKSTAPVTALVIDNQTDGAVLIAEESFDDIEDLEMESEFEPTPTFQTLRQPGSFFCEDGTIIVISKTGDVVVNERGIISIFRSPAASGAGASSSSDRVFAECTLCSDTSCVKIADVTEKNLLAHVNRIVEEKTLYRKEASEAKATDPSGVMQPEFVREFTDQTASIDF